MKDFSANTAPVLELEDSIQSTPCDRLALSFCSIATSLGPEVCGPGGQLESDEFVSAYIDKDGGDVNDDDTGTLPVGSDSDEEEKALSDAQEMAARAEAARRHRLIHGPTRANYAQDRQRIEAARQNQLNNFILRESKATLTSRQDHLIMLHILIGEAYNRDPERRQHREEWRRIVAAVRREYWGANAIFTLSPDPYHNVLANLSSLMVWNGEVRHWGYGYNAGELSRRRDRQTEVLGQLQRSGKLFL